jgi:hypothetical protein
LASARHYLAPQARLVLAEQHKADIVSKMFFVISELEIVSNNRYFTTIQIFDF